MLFRLDDGRRKARIEQMAVIPVTLVEPARVGPVQPMHSFGEVGRREGEHDMEVVRHQAIPEARPSGPEHRLRQERHEHAPVRIVDVDRIASHSACCYVQRSSDRFDAMWTPHVGENLERCASCVEMVICAVSALDVAACLARRHADRACGIATCPTRPTPGHPRSAGPRSAQAASAAVRRPSSPAIGWSDSITFAMCSSSSRPRSSAPA